jgi:hypothetical protein
VAAGEALGLKSPSPGRQRGDYLGGGGKAPVRFPRKKQEFPFFNQRGERRQILFLRNFLNHESQIIEFHVRILAMNTIHLQHDERYR